MYIGPDFLNVNHSEKFIRKYMYDNNHDYAHSKTHELINILQYQHVSTELMKEIFEMVDYINLSGIDNQAGFTEEFFEMFHGKINWEFITGERYRLFSEPFLIKFKDNVSWKKVFEFRKLKPKTLALLVTMDFDEECRELFYNQMKRIFKPKYGLTFNQNITIKPKDHIFIRTVKRKNQIKFQLRTATTYILKQTFDSLNQIRYFANHNFPKCIIHFT